MRKNRNDNAKKERIIMIASSAFVLAALTMTGVYMQSKDRETQDDGYTIDFTALENNAEEKGQEIARNTDADLADNTANAEDDLDYMPLEAGSNDVQLPGLTDKGKDQKEDQKKEDQKEDQKKETAAADQKPENGSSENNADGMEALQSSEADTEAALSAENGEAAAAEDQELAQDGTAVVETELHYAEDQGLSRPLNGSTLIPFSMDKSVYFTTLDQYKRNNAMIISAAEGTAVTACAPGRIEDIFQNEEIGHAVTVELGDGYRITYGQLRDIQVSQGSYVDAGDTIGTVAAPTKYFSREGSNLYLRMTAGDTPVNPETLFQ